MIYLKNDSKIIVNIFKETMIHTAILGKCQVAFSSIYNTHRVN